MSKQKIISSLPSRKEWHLPGYNWNGPGTSIYKRIGLSYKGGVGSESYFLPVNKLDLAAFEHDLLYYSPNNIARAKADEIYLKSFRGAKVADATSRASNVAIWTQLIGRTYLPLAKVGASTHLGGKALRKLLTAYEQGQRPGAGNLMSVITLMSTTDVFKPVKGVKDVYNSIMGQFEGSREFWVLKGANKEVLDSYKIYLSKVGDFNDSDEFVVKKNIDRSEAQKAYRDFFKSFKTYIKFTNDFYKDTDGFEPYEIPKLNTHNLEKVSEPVSSTPPVITLTPAGKRLEEKMGKHLMTIEDIADITKKIEKNDEPLYTTSTMPRTDNIEVEVPVKTGSPVFSGTSGVKVVPVKAPKKPKKKDEAKAEAKAEVKDTSKALVPTPVSDDAKIAMIKDLYTKAVQGDSKDAYTKLVAFAKGRPIDMNLVSGVVNEITPFPKGSPMYVSTPKSLEDHFKVISSIKGTTFMSHEDTLDGKHAFNAYVKDKDPTGSIWAKTAGIEGLIVKSGKKFKKTIKKTDAIRATKAVNARNSLLGIKPMPTGLSKKDLIDQLQKLKFGEVVDIYKRHPSLTPSGREGTIQASIRRETAERRKRTPAGIASTLTGSSPEEVVRNFEQKSLEQFLAKELMSVVDGKLIYRPETYFKGSMKPKDVSGALQQIVGDTIAFMKFSDALDKVRDTPDFRENTDVGRMNILQKAIKDIPSTPAFIEKILREVMDPDFIRDLHKTVGGPPDSVSLIDVMESIEKVGDASPSKIGDLTDIIQEYDSIVVPQMQEHLGKSMAATVEQPADIRVLPKGVKITPIDAKKELKESLELKTEKQTIRNRLEEIKDDKFDAKGAGLTKLIVEEEDLIKRLKELSPEKKDAKGHQGGNIRRQGALRPHLKNPTEAAVKQAIGETPEQQMKDFTNWFTFDIPVDQTGVGSLNTNPLVKQNEAREKFLGEGTLYKHFNQTYELTGGVEERKQFFVQHDRLFKEGVARGLLTRKVLSEEDAFLAKFSRGSNGLFPQDQTKAELNQFRDIYQTPNDFFGGVQYPMQSVTNPSVMVDDFRKNTNLFTSP